MTPSERIAAAIEWGTAFVVACAIWAPITYGAFEFADWLIVP